MRKLIILLLLSIVYQLSFGAEELMDGANTGYDLTNNIIVSSTPYQEIVNDPLGWDNDFSIAQVKNEIVFGIDETLPQLDLDFKYKVVFDLTWKELSGTNLVVQSENGITLELDYSPNMAYQDQEVYTFSGGLNVEITNVQLFKFDDNTSAYVATNVDRDNLFLRSSIETEYYYDFNYQSTPSSNVNLTTDGSDIVVNWPFLQGAEAYDLEWTWVNAYTGNVSSGVPTLYAETDVSYDFKNNASRVRVTGNEYRIPSVYEAGYFLVRYRGIGRSVAYPNTNIEGAWMTDGTIYTDQNSVDVYPSLCKITTIAFENDNMLYGATMTFVEEGKSGVEVAYMDGLLKPRQTQTQLNSQEEIVVGSTVYDYYGRPAIQVMGSPVEQTDLGYVNKLNMFDNTTPYDKAVFHKDNLMLGDCGPKEAVPMDASASKGSAKYYSKNNLNKEGAEAYLPDANGYNFAQIHYVNDPTGRVKRVGGVGPDHQLGEEGHYTETITEAVNDKNEIYGLLGSEAAHYSNYTKIITKGIQGQVSVAILDNMGRTVISYLEGGAPSGLEAIEGNGTVGTITVDLTDFTSQASDLLDQGILLVEDKIAVTDPNQVYSFNYDFETITYTDCLPLDVCFDCVYEVEFTVTPAEGLFTAACPLTDGVAPDPIPSSWTHTVGEISSFNTDCGGPILFSDNNTSSFDLKFPKFGEYYVTKKLKVAQAPIEYYWDAYVDNADPSCLLTYDDFYANAVLDIDYTSCYDGNPCELEFLLTHGSLDEYLANNPGNSQNDYEELESSFLLDCENQPICEQILPLMLLDLRIGGQYGDPSGTDLLSVFNSSGTLNESWRTLPIVVNGTPVMTINSLGVSVPVNDPSISLVEYLNLFQDEWANSLLPAHPEYQTYLFCDAYPEVFNYELAFKNIDSYQDAFNAGYITPVDPTLYPNCFQGSSQPYNFPVNSADPLILLLNGGLSLSASYIYDDNFVAGTNSYQDAASYMLSLCGGTTMYDLAVQMSNGTTFGQSNCDLDAQWQAFRNLYLARRNMVLQVIMEGRAMSIPNNTCIRCIDYSSFYPSICNPTYTGYATKNKRFLMFDQLMPFSFNQLMTDPTAQATLNAQANVDIDQHCTNMCASYADDWMGELSGCGPLVPLQAGDVWQPGGIAYENFKNDLIAICEGGCSAAWPFPSQYNSNPSSPVFASFETYLAQYTTGNNIDCSHLLISNPAPVANQTIVPYLSQCGCDQLMSVSDEQAFEQAFGFIPLNFCQDRETCSSITGVSFSQYPNVGSIVWDPAQISLAESTIASSFYNCNNFCIDCDNLRAGISSFLTQYPQATVEDNPALFTAFINQLYGTTMDYYTLTALLEKCDQISNGTNVTVGLSVEGLAFVDILNEMISNDLTSSTTYSNQWGQTPLPSLYGGVFGGCSNALDYTYAPDFSSGTSWMFNFSVGVDGSDDPCHPCGLEPLIVAPLSLAGWTTTMETVDAITAITSVYMTPLDVSLDGVGGLYHFHITADVLDPQGNTVSITLKVENSCFSALGDIVACENWTTEITDDCVAALVMNAALDAEAEYGSYLAIKKKEFIKNYIATCSQVDETYEKNYVANKYHKTLSYYDRAGNLVKTVPPKGINPLSVSQIADVAAQIDNQGGASVYPNHSFVTYYEYNSLNQPITSTTPGGGATNYWYDHIGRMAISQNARQAALTADVINGNPTPSAQGVSLPAYSYTLYDEQSRPVEVGEIIQPTLMTKAIAKDPTQLENWRNELSAGANQRYRNHVVRTQYSEGINAAALAEFGSDGYGDARNRIATVSVVEDYVEQTPGWTYPTPDYLEHYQYDVHGNVVSYLNENTDLIADNRQFLRTDYEYDLINGLIYYIHFQQGKVDQYSHYYKYNTDNRLKEVWTSKDGMIWDRDVDYNYRLDGQLARTELGDIKVQGCDYAYTLQGWLKGMNSGVLNPTKDMGKDGAKYGEAYMTNNPDIHRTVAQDAFGYTMGYYEGDYASIDNSLGKNFLVATAGTAFETDVIQLYNGNITSVVTAMMDMDENPIDVTGTTYRYDQLHRFKESHVFSANDITTQNSFVNAQRQNSTLGANNTLADYEVHVDYDPNGNIQKLDRRAYQNGTTDNKMDDFNYDYPMSTANNRLGYVNDGVTGTVYDDIKDGQTTGNYQYHADGSLLSDLQEEIKYLEWYPNGKLKQVYRTGGSTQPDLYFEYNPKGQRILKVEKTKDANGVLLPETAWNYSYYGVEGNGTVLAIYNKTETAPVLHRSEATILGTNRVGLDTRKVLVNEVLDNHHQRVLGQKMFELTDHLGNVKEVITDRKLIQSINDPQTGDKLLCFLPDVVAYTDYYPYGMEMPGRKGASLNNYRYAFNGMEKDNEVSGKGNSYTTMFRQYDPRLGRWKSTDPVIHHNMSPYNAFDGNPIFYIDPSGADSEGTETLYPKKDGKKHLDIKKRKGDYFIWNGNTNSWSLLPSFPLDVSTWAGSRKVSSEFSSLSINKQKELMERYRRMSSRAYLSRGAKDLYNAIYNGKSSYSSYFRAGKVTFGKEFAANFSAGWLSWDKDGYGNSIMHIASVTIGSTIVIGVAATWMSGSMAVSVASPALTSALTTASNILFSVSEATVVERSFSGLSNIGLQLYNNGGNLGDINLVSFGGSIASGNPFLGNSIVSSGLSISVNKGVEISNLRQFAVDYTFGKIGGKLKVPAIKLANPITLEGAAMETFINTLFQGGVEVLLNEVNNRTNEFVKKPMPVYKPR